MDHAYADDIALVVVRSPAELMKNFRQWKKRLLNKCILHEHVRSRSSKRTIRIFEVATYTFCGVDRIAYMAIGFNNEKKPSKVIKKNLEW